MRQVTILIRLHGCAGWHDSSPGAHFRRYFFWRCGSYVHRFIETSDTGSGWERVADRQTDRQIDRYRETKALVKQNTFSQLAFYVNLHRAVIGPSATLTGRWRPDIDLRRMLTGFMYFAMLINIGLEYLLSHCAANILYVPQSCTFTVKIQNEAGMKCSWKWGSALKTGI